MKVIEYLNYFNFEELRSECEKLYANNECLDFHYSPKEQWESIYHAFIHQKRMTTRNFIQINWTWKECYPLIGMNCLVYDEYHNLLGPLAIYSNMKEVMDMQVRVNADVNITNKEIAAGLFWEITYIATREKKQLFQDILAEKLQKSLRSNNVIIAIKSRNDNLLELLTKISDTPVYYYNGNEMPKYELFFEELKKMKRNSILYIDNITDMYKDSANRPTMALCIALIESNGICFHLVLGVEPSQYDRALGITGSAYIGLATFYL